MIKEVIGKVVGKEDLTVDEAREVMKEIMEGKATCAQIGSLLTGLRMKGETSEEIYGFAHIMRDKAEHINLSHLQMVDTCGTGGDGAGTFNISTTACFVAAGAGLSVAKHGNRSVSSKCGSADVLEALGVKIDLPPSKVEYTINEIGLGFLYAPVFHKAMKHAIAPRKEIGIRSIFNILGPLTNPARAKFQVVGVYNADLTEIVAEALAKLEVKNAYVVYGAGGLDEISTLGPTKITHLNGGNIKTFNLFPEDFGFPRRDIKSLKGLDAQYNAMVTKRVLKGEKGPKREIVLLNAAAVIAAAGAAKDIEEGVKVAAEAIDTGRAMGKLEELIAVTNNYLKMRII